MDHFMEEVVVKHNRSLEAILYVLSWIMLVIFGLFGLLMLQSLLYQFSVPALIETVIFIGGAVLLIFVFAMISSAQIEEELLGLVRRIVPKRNRSDRN